MAESTSNRFILLTKVTLISLMLVVVAGGVVRMTGSGMGCPDWPKCFEQYIPPTSESQLPENYKEIYSEKRDKKIQRFSDLLEKIGFQEQAEKLRNDTSLLVEQNFDPFNTWMEFINRLVGAISGVLVFAVFVFSFRYLKTKKGMILLALAQVILLAFQAWMGAMTVATNLTPWVLTSHMLLAIIIIAIQIRLIRLAMSDSKRTVVVDGIVFKGLVFLGILISGVQILAGTGVRQLVDEVAKVSLSRDLWISELGSGLFFHRSFAIAVVLVNLAIFYLNVKRNIRLKEVNWLIAIVFVEALSGIGMAYMGIPAFLQPIHLVLSIVMIAIQFQLIQKIKISA